MSTTLAGTNFVAHYVRDPHAIETIDIDRISRELADGSDAAHPASSLRRIALTEYDHVVVVSDRTTGRCIGFLGARDGATARDEEFILLRAAFVAEPARGRGLMRRMIALVLLRAAGNGDMPRVIAARTSCDKLVRALAGFALRLPDVVTYPAPPGEPTNLRAAGLAQSIARQVGRGVRFEVATGALRGGRIAAGGTLLMEADSVLARFLGPPDQVLAVVDMRGADEESIIDAARRIYRKR